MGRAMEVLINSLAILNFFLVVALIVAWIERYEDRHIPRPTAVEVKAEKDRKRRIMESWRR